VGEVVGRSVGSNVGAVVGDVVDCRVGICVCTHSPARAFFVLKIPS